MKGADIAYVTHRTHEPEALLAGASSGTQEVQIHNTQSRSNMPPIKGLLANKPGQVVPCKPSPLPLHMPHTPRLVAGALCSMPKLQWQKALIGFSNGGGCSGCLGV